MIDLQRVEKYRENNRIEAKKALGGLPKSLWETYSAFANTLGGVILLGVKEERDKSLHPVCLPNPERLLEEFWTIINDKTKVSANILTQNHVEIVGVGESRFIAITVPRATRQDRPIYIGADPLVGSYKRNGEGDYRCEAEEIQQMLLEAAKPVKDMRPLARLDMSALDKDSVELYRQTVLKMKPRTPLLNVSEREFLEKLGVIAKDEHGVLRPTPAGLLTLGDTKAIKETYPHFRLRFEEKIQSNSKEIKQETREENVFTFFNRVNARILELLQNADTDAKTSATEALTNCLVNADYRARSGVYITYKRTEIVFTNPGGFKVGVERAKQGGVSSPRNAGLSALFRQIGVGNGTGSGIPDIFSLWMKNGRGMPVICESFHPERVSVRLPFSDKVGKRTSIKSKAGKAVWGEEEKQAIISFLTSRIHATVGDISSALRLPSVDVKTILAELTEQGIIKKDGSRYELKN